MALNTELERDTEDRADGLYGAGFIEYQARTNFRDMCRIYGFEGARAIMAEIMISEASRKRITIDG